jgi:hypothetical protein
LLRALEWFLFLAPLSTGVNHLWVVSVVLGEDEDVSGKREYMKADILVPFFVSAMFAWIAWVIFSTIRRYSLGKMQSGVQMKLLEKIDSGQALVAYADTESGRRFMESLRTEQTEPEMPYRRILSGAQWGVVLSAFGIGMLVLHSTGVAPEREFTIFGGLALALGIGFVLASAASYVLSRSFGLLPRGSNA